MTGISNRAVRPPVEPYIGGNRNVPLYKAMAPTADRPGDSGKALQKDTGGDQTKRVARLLIDATRDFGKISRPSSEQIIQYKELFYQLIDRLQSSDRRMISAMLARLTFTPRAVALYFAQDDIEIAAPFLLFSSVLGDLDLRAIAKKKGKAYAETIARRNSVLDAHTKSTLDAIIAVDEPGTPIKTLRETPIIDDTKWLNGEEIVALASVGGRLGKKSIPTDTSATAAASQSDAMSVKRTDEGLLPKQETRHLLRLARNQDREGIAQFIETLCGLKAKSAQCLLEADSGDELVYLIKALGIPSPHSMQFLLMMMPRIGRDIKAYRQTKSLLGDLEIGICRMIFNEIGAEFEIGGKPYRKAEATSGPQAGYQETVKRRGDTFEDAPLVTTTPRKSRFSFEQSLMATG